MVLLLKPELIRGDDEDLHLTHGFLWGCLVNIHVPVGVPDGVRDVNCVVSELGIEKPCTT